MRARSSSSSFFFFNDTATTEIYTLSLHDALPISAQYGAVLRWAHVPLWVLLLSIVWFVRLYLRAGRPWLAWSICGLRTVVDRKSTRLNSSHDQISYAVFCLKKKNKC